MEPVETDFVCPKCGERMLLLPDTDWSLFDLHTVEMICPNCVHVEQIETIVAERARAKSYNSLNRPRRLRLMGAPI